MGLCETPYAITYQETTSVLCASNVLDWTESAEDIAEAKIDAVWAKYHPPLDANSEPDYSKKIDALPLVNAMADELTDLMAISMYTMFTMQGNLGTEAQMKYSMTLKNPMTGIM